MKSRTVQCKFTLIIRICKKNILPIILNDIRNGLMVRINESPLFIGYEYRNKVVKENNDFYIINIRDETTIEFHCELLQTPFDNFSVPFVVELTSRDV